MIRWLLRITITLLAFAFLVAGLGCGRVDPGPAGTYRYSWQLREAEAEWNGTWHGEAVLELDGTGYLGYPEEDPSGFYGTDFSAEWPWAVTWEYDGLLRIEAPAHGQYQQGWTFVLGAEGSGLGFTGGQGAYPMALVGR